MSVSPVVRLDHIHLTLTSDAGAIAILKDITLDFQPGETVAITGPSGSGKTSLLMVLAGLEQPTSGKIVITGQDLSSFDEDALARFRRLNIGIVFQNFHLLPAMTALENVSVPLELAGDAAAHAKAGQSLSSVRLGHRLSHYPAQLSGGEQQRVAVARATVAHPPLILADEPTGNLDHATGEAVIAMLFDQVRATGATLILVTHDPQLAARCDRQIHIADGRVSA